MLVRIDERTEATAKKVDVLYQIVVEGNGKPALVTQTATLEHRVTVLEAGSKDARAGQRNRYMLWAALGPGIISFVEMLIRWTRR